MNSNTQAVSTEVAIALVADQRRRRVLRHLVENGDGAVELDDLIENVRNESNAAPSGSNGARLRVELLHVHLPKLDDAGVVDYDDREGTVRYRSSDTIEKLVSFIDEELP